MKVFNMNSLSNRFLFVIGPQRTGTTWLYSLFASQPKGVFIDRLEKENYLFNRCSGRSIKKRRKMYLKRLSGKGAPKIFIDVCSTYFGHPDAIERILECFPNARFAYIHREEKARKKSFSEHREFNLMAAWIIGYNVSWPLYEKQARFDEFEGWLKNRIPPEQLCRLEFSDLKTTDGQVWVETLEDFTGAHFNSLSQGVVNESRKNASFMKRLFFVGVRLIQAARIHILLRKIKMKLSYSGIQCGLKGFEL